MISILPLKWRYKAGSETPTASARGLVVIQSIDSVGVAETVGMVTDRDIAMRVVAAGIDPAQTDVEAIMTPEIQCCQEDATLEKALEIMAAKQVHRLVVLDTKGIVTGLLSLKALASHTGNKELVSRVVDKSLSL